MARRDPVFAAVAVLALGGCVMDAPTAEDVARERMPAPTIAGLCHAEAVSPALYETVTEQVIEPSGADMAEGRPRARLRSQTATRLVTPRSVQRVEIPCALEREEPDFVMQVQRALAARGLYDGPVHGVYDAPTRAAVAAFQETDGPAGGLLSMESAKAMGLVALGRGG